MTATLFNANNPMVSLIDDAGLPISGGTYSFYVAGTTTAKAVYLDEALTIPVTVITLDAAGRLGDADGDSADIYMPLGELYKIIVKDADGVTIRTFPNYRASNSGGSSLVSVTDYGAVGDGVTDSTNAIDNASATGQVIVFPDGDYVYTGDVDALYDNHKLIGTGRLKIDSYTYPVQRREVSDPTWQGTFECWRNANALESDTQRVQVPQGCSFARIGFALNSTVYREKGDYVNNAIKIQRNATNTSTASDVFCIPLTRLQTRALRGLGCIVQFHAKVGEDYSGNGVTPDLITVKVNTSVEFEQSVTNADGTYSSNNVETYTGTFTLTEAARAKHAPYYFSVTIPADAQQACIVFVIPRSGTAGVEDAVYLENVKIYEGGEVANIIALPFGSSQVLADQFYQATVAYGSPRGTSTQQGNVGAVAIIDGATNNQWAFAINVRFPVSMIWAPVFYFQSHASGTESRLYDNDLAVPINGLGYFLNENGVMITNNSVSVNVGSLYTCHWTAEVLP